MDRAARYMSLLTAPEVPPVKLSAACRVYAPGTPEAACLERRLTGPTAVGGNWCDYRTALTRLFRLKLPTTPETPVTLHEAFFAAHPNGYIGDSWFCRFVGAGVIQARDAAARDAAIADLIDYPTPERLRAAGWVQTPTGWMNHEARVDATSLPAKLADMPKPCPVEALLYNRGWTRGSGEWIKGGVHTWRVEATGHWRFGGPSGTVPIRTYPAAWLLSNLPALETVLCN